MFKWIILLYIFTLTQGACPSSETIRNVVNFKTVVIQAPFEQYPGVSVFNGVTMQDKGICTETGDMCFVSNNTCNNSQQCRALSQSLLFNLRPKNLSKSMNSNEITQAVRNAKIITFNKFVTLPPYIPNILCVYNVSNFDDYMCLPRFCDNKPCLVSKRGCTCISTPCQLYYAISVK